MSFKSITDLHTVLSRYPAYSGISTFVETGTAEGATTIRAAGIFSVVHTIELSRALFERAQRNLSGIVNVTMHAGDSAAVLPFLTREIEDPALFYLDAHYCEQYDGLAAREHMLPLRQELKAILTREKPDIVIVDDVHCFERDLLGRPDEGLWRKINRSSLCEIAGERLMASEIVADWLVLWLK